MSKAWKIMIVEDDSALRELLVEVLENDGYAVVVAQNGQQALELLSSERPDLVLLDLRLPIMNGREVLQQLRQRPCSQDTPVILMTAAPGERAPDGIQGFLRKPFSITDLLIKVGRLLSGERCL